MYSRFFPAGVTSDPMDVDADTGSDGDIAGGERSAACDNSVDDSDESDENESSEHAAMKDLERHLQCSDTVDSSVEEETDLADDIGETKKEPRLHTVEKRTAVCRERVLEAYRYLCSVASSLGLGGPCTTCDTAPTVLFCTDCELKLCRLCDDIVHSRKPLHDRRTL